jgi:hypothetical protein
MRLPEDIAIMSGETRERRETLSCGSAIIHHFAFKSPFFMSLGAFGLKRRILVLIVLMVGLGTALSLISCGGYEAGYLPPSRLTNRVLASQGVTSTFSFGGLRVINGQNDTLPRVAEMSAGSNPALMAISPTRGVVAVFDGSSNSVYGINTVTEAGLGRVQLPGPTTSMVVPTASPIGYAAVPTATVNGYAFTGAVDVMNLTAGAISSTIGVTHAQTVVANGDGTQLLVFSNDSDSVTVLFPGNAVPPVDTSCFNNPPNAVCTIVTGFDRPVNAVVNGTTAYILNCGAECGGIQASVQTLDLSTLAVGTPTPVNGATIGFLSGSQLYVAGNGTPTGPPCKSIASAATTAATYCGTLDIVDLNTMTDPYFNSPSTEIAIPDGYHQRIDMSVNGQLFIGSRVCTNVGDVNNPVGEVRGCLAIYNTTNNSVIIPPDNGNVDGLQSFTQRNIEYVAEGGFLRVYDTNKNILLINKYVPQGTINVVGYVGDAKAIDFF